jgi:hypothetical protein
MSRVLVALMRRASASAISPRSSPGSASSPCVQACAYITHTSWPPYVGPPPHDSMQQFNDVVTSDMSSDHQVLPYFLPYVRGL